MRKKAMCKDFFMEIRTSLNRFISIFFIVAMGVAFFSGIRASEPDMRLTADEYFDDHRLLDLRVVGTLGLTQEDVAALRKIEGVSEAEPSYMADVKCSIEENEKVVHLEAITQLNTVSLLDGRMPERANECLLEADAAEQYGLSIGHTIRFYSDEDQGVSDTLATDTFTVVGTCASPFYISFDKGSTSIGSGKVDSYAYLKKEAFSMEAYTQIFLTLDGAAEETAYTDGYRQVVEAVQDRVEGIAGTRCEARYDAVYAQAHDKINDAEEELANGRQEAQDKLTDAKQQIDDGQRALDDGWRELESQKAVLSESRQQLQDSRTTLDSGWAEYNASLQKTEQGLAQTEQAKAQLASARELLAQNETQYQESLLQYQDASVQYENGAAELAAAKETLKQINALIAAGLADEEQIAMAQALEGLIAQKEPELTAAQQELAAGKAGLDAACDPLWIQGQAELAAQTRGSLEQAVSELEYGVSELAAAKNQLDSGEAEYAAGAAKLEEGERRLSDAENTLREESDELADARTEYEAGREEAFESIAEGERKLAEAKKEELADLSMPEWMVTDRDSVPNYTGYGQSRRPDAGHWAGIPGVVFPGGRAGQPDHHDPNGGGGAHADRRHESARLRKNSHRHEISGLRLSRHRRRQPLRASGGAKNFPLCHHPRLWDYVQAHSQFGDTV